MEQMKLTLSVQEAAEISGIGKDTIYKLIHDMNSDFPFFRVNSKTFIIYDLLCEWLHKVAKENKHF
jgi:excisionase family DNA binding protein